MITRLYYIKTEEYRILVKTITKLALTLHVTVIHNT